MEVQATTIPWGRTATTVGFLLALVVQPGCATLSDPSMKTVPLAWRNRHPWGPEANAARDAGTLGYRTYTAKMACWAEFARQHLQDGDVLFRRGRSVGPLGNAASRFIANITDSPFSHDAIVCWQGDSVWIYDAEAEGTRKMPFEVWMLDVADETLAVKRLQPEYRDRIPNALAYCEDIYQRNLPFDRAFGVDDTEFYCSELIEKAYRAAGLCLSEPVPIRCLPNYARWRWVMPLGALTRGLRVDTPIFVPGNECYGTYGSPYLETVYVTDCVAQSLQGRKGPSCYGSLPVAAIGECPPNH